MLEAETNGQSDRRLTLLSQALELDSELVAAHWHIGDVKHEGKWVAYDGPSASIQSAALVEEYRRKRDQSKDTLNDQLQLARWCEKVDLTDEAKTHWQAALKLNPRSDEARLKLGLVLYKKQFLTQAQIDSLEEQQRIQQDANFKWKGRVSKLRDQIENKRTSSQALQELRETIDPAAIPAMEAYFAKGKPEAAIAVVQSLSQDARLHRHPIAGAVCDLLPHSAEVRDAAAKALKPCSLYAYVPLLLGSTRYARYRAIQ